MSHRNPSQDPPRKRSRTPSQRALAARIGAYHMHSKYDGKVTTANARKAFLGRFLIVVDPNQELPDAERNRRAAAAKSAYFTKLALQSSVARTAKQKRRAA